MGIWTVQAQPSGAPFIENFKPREFKASSANYDVVQNGNGLMYFANYRGVLEYDGISWQLFPLPNGAATRSLAADSNGVIYVGAVGEMGYLAPDEKGEMRYFSLYDRLDTTFFELPRSTEVFGTRYGAWFRGVEEGQLFYWNGDSLQHYPVTQTGPDYELFYFLDQLWAQHPIEGLMVWDGGHFQALPGATQLRGLRLESLIAVSANRLLGYDARIGLIVIRLDEGTIQVGRWQSDLGAEENLPVVSELRLLSSGRIAVGTVQSGVYILETSGELVQHVTSQAGLQDNLVMGMYEDAQQSLWLTLSKGISRVEIASPLTQWNEASGLEGIVFSAMHHQGRLYAATTLGTFRLEGSRFQPVANLTWETWNLITVTTGGRERLVAATSQGLFEVTAREAKPIPGAADYFKAIASEVYPGLMYAISSTDGIEVLRHNGREWVYQPSDTGMVELNTQFSHGVETDAGELWLQELESPNSLLRIRLREGSYGIAGWESVVLPDSFPVVQSLIEWNGEVALATEKGIWRFDAQAQTFVPETTLGISGMGQASGVLRFTFDPLGRIWLERYRGNRRWLELAYPQANGSYRRDSVALQSLSETEVWSEVYVGPQGVAWIGTPEGLYAYNHNSRPPRGMPFAPQIRQVVVGKDSILYYGHAAKNRSRPEIPYQGNALTIYYATPYFGGESEVEYSYFLEGWDETWSSWKPGEKKDYTLLPPGSYEFQVKARNLYNQESEVATYRFVIATPWYRSVWAFVGYAAIIVLLVYVTVKLNTRRLYLQNEHLERIVYERTSEIWAQHKEIIKKSATLKRQKEELAQQHSLVEEKNQALEQTLHQLKDAQSKLVDSEKMASLGQLTAGIAHEINNPINFVKGNVGPLTRDFEEIRELFLRLQQVDTGQDLGPQFAELKAYCEEIDAAYLFEEMAMLLTGINEGAERTKRIVDGLKIFSRSDTDAFKMADVHQGIDATLTLLSNKLKERFEITRDYANLPLVECMPGKLNQVFMNVLSNAIQAMEDQAGPDSEGPIGTISIKTREIAGDPGAVQIDIQDTGPGIPADIAPRIFDPFFTTKDVGQGTGLGLSISFGIIDKHGGQIEAVPVASGACFRVTIPLRQPAAINQSASDDG